MANHLHPSIKRLQKKQETLLFLIGAVLFLYIIGGIAITYFPELIGNYSAFAGGYFVLTGLISVAIAYGLIRCFHKNLKPICKAGSRLLTDTKPFSMMLSGIKDTALMSCFILRDPDTDDGKRPMAVVCKYTNSALEPAAEDVPVQVYYRPNSSNVLVVCREKDKIQIGKNLSIKDLRQEIKKMRLALWISLPVFIVLAFLGAWRFGGMAYESHWNAKLELERMAWLPITGKILSNNINLEETVWSSKYYKTEIRYGYMANNEPLEGVYLWSDYSSSNSENSALDLSAGYPPGSKVTVYYNPDDPSQAVLERGHKKEKGALRARNMVLINLICIEIAIVIFIGRIRFIVCQDTKKMEELIQIISEGLVLEEII